MAALQQCYMDIIRALAFVSKTLKSAAINIPQFETLGKRNV